jgi:hypothetical protein
LEKWKRRVQNLRDRHRADSEEKRTEGEEKEKEEHE